MHDQAVENWLLRIMRDARERYPEHQWAFYSTLGEPGRLDDTVRDLGGEVIHSRIPVGQTRKFISELHNTIERGRYDVLHAHHDVMSAVYLLASARTRILRRIVEITESERPHPGSGR